MNETRPIGRSRCMSSTCARKQAASVVLFADGGSFCHRCGSRGEHTRRITESQLARRDAARVERLAWASTVWQRAHAIADGDPVDRYLVARGLTRPDHGWPHALRCAANVDHPIERRARFDAMIAPIVDVAGATIGFAMTFIRNAAKAPVSVPRIFAGSTAGAVRLDPPSSVIVVAEGVETSAAARQLFALPTWAAGSASALAKLQIPDSVRRVVIVADRDRTGADAARTLRDRCSRADIPSRIYWPPRRSHAGEHDHAGTDLLDHLWEQRADRPPRR